MRSLQRRCANAFGADRPVETQAFIYAKASGSRERVVARRPMNNQGNGSPGQLEFREEVGLVDIYQLKRAILPKRDFLCFLVNLCQEHSVGSVWTTR